MDDYYSRQKRGGVIASKIEHQDTVGLIFATELLDKTSKYGKLDNDIQPWAIVPEGNDDLEAVFHEDRIFIQVKSSELSNKKEFEKILYNFKSNKVRLQKKNIDIKTHFILYALSGLNGKLRGFDVKHQELINSIDVYDEREIISRKKQLLTDYEIDHQYLDLLDTFEIRTQNLLRDNSEVFAIFAHKLRKCYSIRDFGDKLLSQIYDELIDLFGEGRRNRKAIKRKEFLHKIHSTINVNENFLLNDLSIQTGYTKTDLGYEKNSSDISHKLYKQVKKARWRIQKQWLKEYGFVSVIHFLFGHWKKCSICGHSLMANFGGLSGLACPDCGYQPYATLFLACSCGNYQSIKTQPALTIEEFYEAVRIYFQNNSSKCDQCNNSILDDYWKYRLMVLPFPYPINKSNKELRIDIPKKTLVFQVIVFLIVISFIFWKVI